MWQGRQEAAVSRIIYFVGRLSFCGAHDWSTRRFSMPTVSGTGLRNTRAQQLAEFVFVDRPVEIIALELVAGMRAQEFGLLLGFYSLGNQGHVQALAHRNDRRGDGFVFRIAG